MEGEREREGEGCGNWVVIDPNLSLQCSPHTRATPTWTLKHRLKRLHGGDGSCVCVCVLTVRFKVRIRVRDSGLVGEGVPCNRFI